jgi:hypothetical protein
MKLNDRLGAAIRLRQWLWLALASFLGGLLVFLPAMLFRGVADRLVAAPNQLHIDGGSIWSGRATLSVGSAATFKTIPFSWQFDPLALLRLRAGLKLNADSAALRGGARLGFGARNIEIRDTSLRLDAGLVGALNPLAALLGPSGMLQLDSLPGDAVLVSYQGAPLASGKFQLRAENVGLRSAAPAPFGSFALELAAHDAALDYQLREASGPLKLDGGGSLRWTLPRQFSYRGIASATGTAPDVLAPLKSVGRPLPDGRLQIDYQSAW